MKATHMLLCVALVLSVSLVSAVNQKPNSDGLRSQALLVQNMPQTTPQADLNEPAPAAMVEQPAATPVLVEAMTAATSSSGTGASYWPSLIILTGVSIAFIMSISYTYATMAISLEPSKNQQQSAATNLLDNGSVSARQMARVKLISKQISDGADSFLQAEYTYIIVFMFVFSALLLAVICPVESTTKGVFTTIAFVIGCCTSMLCGFIGMKIATYANGRTTLECADQENGIARGFVAAFKAGSVMGFALTGFGVLILYIIVEAYTLQWSDWDNADSSDDCEALFHCLAGYGLGGSSVALFGRVGGGIYTKAADVGADLCKIEMSMNEDSAQNPAVIADNVGDNVGDIAGMGADLFGSFAESTCACMVVISQSSDLYTHWNSLMLPIIIAGLGIFICMITSFFASHVGPPTTADDVEPVLKRQLLISTILMTPTSYAACYYFLPGTSFTVSTTSGITATGVFVCVACGLWSGLAIGYITEYYTSKAYHPVQELAQSTETGAATNIIYGLSLGYKSVIIPIICLCITVYISWALADMLGIAMAAVGILSTMSIGLTIDGFGPICDNAGGIAEMAGFPAEVRVKTDALDAAGNTTAAIGKGFAIGSAALVSLALWGAFAISVDLDSIDMLSAFVFAGLLFGAMLPYWFSALTMKAVGFAAREMVVEVRRQFADTSKVNPTDGDDALRKGAALTHFLRTEDKRVELADHIEDRVKEEGKDNGDAKFQTFSHQDLDTMSLDQFEAAIASMSLQDCQTELAQMEADLEQQEASGTVPMPDYDRCIQISTKASLRQMFGPGALVMITPLVVGYAFGVYCLCGMLTGVLVSGVQMAISMSNTGGAWDNAKKYVEAGDLVIPKAMEDADGNMMFNADGSVRYTPEGTKIIKAKGTKYHQAAVIGDTVGDPMKDTSGPAINILIKLSAITSLVFADTFPDADDGGYIEQWIDSW